MPKMAVVSKPILIGGLILIGAAVVFVSNGQDAPKTVKKPPKSHSKSLSKLESEFTEEDYTTRFGKPNQKLRNLFSPLVVAEAPKTAVVLPTGPVEPPKDVDKIPAELADNDGNWVYTGFAQVNGKDLALIENSTTHQGGFVKQGEIWKKTKIIAISTGSIVLLDKDGKPKVILRYDPNRPQPAQTPGGAPNSGSVQPVNPLQGPIGGPSGFRGGPSGPPPGMQIRPMPGNMGTMIIQD
ncbi:hypothetical protein [Fimbriimonas ginsengisoli]|uniref:Uncharacterized protein n=1 Tax=Fimbriimonas ginsengisoli Gsoil 348 TaxID=661478 RepID=A0A068NWM0_FIMGI|nr:hypothetical protein [Fimbriimonas ginsengisoli]AIE85989.1 hypothetical protein OP10G_2621 [Fimbriimonas ginsengisoli Gsoil 348]